eukprot:3365538-Rhodomonas_salina.1
MVAATAFATPVSSYHGALELSGFAVPLKQVRTLSTAGAPCVPTAHVRRWQPECHVGARVGWRS